MTTTVINNTIMNTMKYNLQKFKETIFYGFEFEIPDETVTIINYLTSEIGSTSQINNTVFQKKEHVQGETVFNNHHNNKGRGKHKKNNKFSESTDEDWEQLRSFQSTRIEQSSGLDGHIDNLRSIMNKLTDKTFQDMRGKIFDILDTIINSSDFNKEIETIISTVIYDISSTNKFFSKIYADLYAELVKKYDCLHTVFTTNFNKFADQYETIQYVDPDINYDGFCENNKINEHRRAKTQFMMNLALNGFISKLSVARILRQLLDTIMNTINRSDKKNEVDEMIENMAILFNEDLICAAQDDSDCEEDELEISGRTIVDTITLLANSKVKDYKSLSNKAIFKCMDLIDM
jgi:hypothetical protein